MVLSGGLYRCDLFTTNGVHTERNVKNVTLRLSVVMSGTPDGRVTQHARRIHIPLLFYELSNINKLHNHFFLGLSFI